MAYVVSGDGNLYAFSATGTTSCSGSPKTCTPLWTAAVGGGTGSVSSVPAASGGDIYVVGGDGVVRAFDASGRRECGGTPTVCTALWSANVSATGGAAPVVAGGTLFVSSTQLGLVALDPAGKLGCSGTPTVCAPLWITYFGGLTSVSDGIAYVAGTDLIEAFDAAGSKNCSGSTPKICTELWQYQPNYPLAPFVPDYPVISGSTLYIQASTPFRQNPAHEDVEAFDANGVTDCGRVGPWTSCTPVWTTADLSLASPPASVANGSLYVSGAAGVAVFDASGVTKCSGAPKVCSALWTSASTETSDAPMSVANGVLFGNDSKHLFALDASGRRKCRRLVCSPLWSATPTSPHHVHLLRPGRRQRAGVRNRRERPRRVRATGLTSVWPAPLDQQWLKLRLRQGNPPLVLSIPPVQTRQASGRETSTATRDRYGLQSKLYHSPQWTGERGRDKRRQVHARP